MIPGQEEHQYSRPRNRRSSLKTVTKNNIRLAGLYPAKDLDIQVETFDAILILRYDHKQNSSSWMLPRSRHFGHQFAKYFPNRLGG